MVDAGPGEGMVLAGWEVWTMCALIEMEMTGAKLADASTASRERK